MNLRVIKGGVLDTIQDLGRYGQQCFGINPGGVMDKFSARVANILTGNDEGEAVLELHYPAGEYFFEDASLIAITGADFSPTINGDEIPNNHPVWVNKFSVLQFPKLRSGARAYLAVNSGFKIDKWENSFSTNLKAHAGGLHGGALKSNDEIPIIPYSNTLTAEDAKDAEFKVFPYFANYFRETNNANEIYVLKGREWDFLEEQSKRRFLKNKFSLTAQSDRMGYRLRGEGISSRVKEIISSGVSFGTIQLLPDGQMVILMADHQTTGGYPRIAHVISAQHSILAQKRAGEYLKFKMVDMDRANSKIQEQERYLRDLKTAINLKQPGNAVHRSK